MRTETRFIQTVWNHYRTKGRKHLPWRKTRDPYRILVSEVMLQQTQVNRVLLKYQSFLRQFPSIKVLAAAPLRDVLKEWQGLGYNRRAKNLHACAKEISLRFEGRIPKNFEELNALPGIGPYTSGAIMAFAYNKPIVMIETNIRTAYLHYFFIDRREVRDREIFELIERTLDKENPREWYFALMDYGAYIKKEFGNPNARSKHYKRQPAFSGSDRQMRGAIIRHLIGRNASRKKILGALSFDRDRLDAQLRQLHKEGLIAKKGHLYSLPL